MIGGRRRARGHARGDQEYFRERSAAELPFVCTSGGAQVSAPAKPFLQADAGYAVAEPGSAPLGADLGGQGGSVQIERVSPAGIVVTGAQLGDIEPTALGDLHLQVSGEQFRIPAVVAERLRPDAFHVMLTGLQLPAARRIAGLLQALVRKGIVTPPPPISPRIEFMAEADRIHEALFSLVRNHCECAIRDVRGAGSTGRLHALPHRGGPLEFVGVRPGKGPITIDIYGYNTVFRFETLDTTPTASGFAVALPARLELRRSRWYRRVSAPSGSWVRFQHALWPELEVVRPLRDVSYAGLAFSADAVDDLLFPGLGLRAVGVHGFDGAPLPIDADVRLLFSAGSDLADTAGTHVAPPPGEVRARWMARIGELLSPRTRVGGVWSADSWDLYERSGYFNLSGKSEAHFPMLRDAFAITSRKVDAAPDIGCQVVWPSERGIEASLSLLRTYSRAWFGYQMARRRDAPADGSAPRIVLREIHYRAYEHALADSDLDWVIGYVQEDARFSKLVHHHLPARHVGTGEAAVVPFRALEVTSSGRRVGAIPGTARVVPASEEDIRVLLARIEVIRPRAYREALDLVTDRYAMESVSEAWRRAGLRRERGTLMAYANDRPIAAAVLETADPGLHLFGLLDCVRFYALRPGGESGYSALLEASRVWFATRARTRFAVLLEGGGVEADALAGITDLGPADLTVLAAALVPNLLEHVFEVTAPRDGRP